jgi:hypothetical protein
MGVLCNGETRLWCEITTWLIHELSLECVHYINMCMDVRRQ